MSAEATLPLAPGDLVAGKYVVDRVLGVGGMGAVFAAVDRASGERVAIKCLLPIFGENIDVITRFLREGSATMRLQSEHIARVSATGALDSGVPYIVMEHLDGRDLRTVVRTSGPLSVQEAASYVGQVCAALAEAHALGIVHRDLKPANLFLTRRPDGSALIKVLDFGIAKYTSPSLLGDHAEMTKTQAVLGSRAYMSPEQMLRPKEVDARADIWSLGVILYFFITGKSPFTSDTTEGMIMRIVSGAPEPLTTFLPDLSPTFEAIVTRCLSKRREDRYSNVTELARALAPFARGLADRSTMTLDDDEKTNARQVQPPEPSGPTMHGYVSTPSQPTTAPSSATPQTVSRTSITRVARRSLRPLLVTLGAAVALLGSAIVVGSVVLGGHHAADAREGVKAAPPVPAALGAVPAVSVAVPAVPEVVPADPVVLPAEQAAVPAAPGALPPDVSPIPAVPGAIPGVPSPIPAVPGAIPGVPSPIPAAASPVPAAPRPGPAVAAVSAPSAKPSGAKAGGVKPGVKPKATSQAADTPW